MKQTISLLLALLLLVMVFTGCGKAEITEDSSSNDSAETTDSSAEESVTASPVDDFEYEENETGITITKYLGSDIDIVFPEEIQGKPVTQLGAYLFIGDYENLRHITFIRSITMPDTITVIGACAFANFPALTTVVLSKNLEVIGSMAFENCPSLTTITLPSTLTEIGNRTFENCTSLKHINIPKSITKWGGSEFLNSGIETIDFEEGIQTIGSTTFAYTNIKTLVLPASIKELSYQAFGGCANLESVTLNEGLITINASAFGGESKLEKVIIPKSVKNITEHAFSGCSTLKALYFEGDAPETYLDEIIPGPFNLSYTVYYHEGAKGFTSPEWFGYPTQIW